MQSDLHPDLLPEVFPAAPEEMACLWSRTSMLQEVWDVVQAARAWPGVAIEPDRGGLCLSIGGVALGHLRWNGRIDLPFGPEVGDRLVVEGMATRDLDHPDQGRVVFDVRSGADVDRAIWLLRLAYLSLDSKSNLCNDAASRYRARRCRSQ